VRESEAILERLRQVRDEVATADRDGVDAAMREVEKFAARTDEERTVAWLQRDMGSSLDGLNRVEITKCVRDRFPQMSLLDALALADLVVAARPSR
jgi:hypothetical protein